MNGSSLPLQTDAIRLALPKARYLPAASAIIRAFGGVVTNGHLRYPLRCGTAYLLRAPDIAQAVADGYFDIGVTPDEWCEEYLASTSTTRLHVVRGEQPLSMTRLSIIGPDPRAWPPTHPPLVATAFPNLCRATLNALGVTPRAILSLRGSLEGVVPDVAEYAYDCVESGRTIAAHALHEIMTSHRQLGLSIVTTAPAANPAHIATILRGLSPFAPSSG